jgi:protein TonB
MFDKLIVSEPEGADFKNRRSYFLVSSLVVGVLFLAAIVISIFAADYSLGNYSFDMAELIAPVVQIPQIQPEPPRQMAPATASKANLPIRQVNMPSLNESPIIPREVSVIPNTQISRPDTKFTIGKLNSDPVPGAGTGRDTGPPVGPSLVADVPNEIERDPVPEPPPAKPPTPAAPSAPKSMGVVNGIAQSLPKPNYPAAAVAINLQGKVDVQVLIDESGRVISAKAVSGNVIFRSAAEQAARNARFTPTLLSKVPVKVTGVIVYNFTRG